MGERRLTGILTRYGPDTVDRAIGELRRRADRLMRAKIAVYPRWTV